MLKGACNLAVQSDLAMNLIGLVDRCLQGGIVEEYQLDNTVNNPDLVPE